MLWSAGQRRLARESRERRAELFQAGRDAHVFGEIAAGKVKPRGSLRLPDYLRPERGSGGPSRGLRDLIRAHGGNVTRAQSAEAMRAAFLRGVAPEEPEPVH